MFIVLSSRCLRNNVMAQFLRNSKTVKPVWLGVTLNYDLSMSVICIRSMCGHECMVLKNALYFVMGYLIAMKIYIELF